MLAAICMMAANRAQDMDSSVAMMEVELPTYVGDSDDMAINGTEEDNIELPAAVDDELLDSSDLGEPLVQLSCHVCIATPGVAAMKTKSNTMQWNRIEHTSGGFLEHNILMRCSKR